MDTTRAIITKALRRAQVLAATESPTAEALRDGLDLLNDMLEEWRDDFGIDFSLEPLELDDEPTAIDRGAMRAVKFNLAVAVANDNNASVPPVVAATAERTFAALAGRFSGHRLAKFDQALLRPVPYDINRG